MYKGWNGRLKIMVLRAVVSMLVSAEEREEETLAATVGARGNDLCRKYTEMVEESNPDDTADGGGGATRNPPRNRSPVVYRVTSLPLDAHQSTVVGAHGRVVGRSKCVEDMSRVYNWWACCWVGWLGII